jgi:hypothetical protein
MLVRMVGMYSGKCACVGAVYFVSLGTLALASPDSIYTPETVGWQVEVPVLCIRISSMMIAMVE